MHCPKCGNPVADTERFCSKCFAVIEPPELRAKIEKFRAGALNNRKSANQTFTVRDASGKDQTYHSLDGMPPDVRAMVERALRGGGPG